MTAKKTPPPRSTLRAGAATSTALSQTSPSTPEQRRERIQALGERVAGYVRFMCDMGTTGGTSAEAKERALTTFYERLLVVERQLGRIQEELLLE
jgi:hypothetical protein